MSWPAGSARSEPWSGAPSAWDISGQAEVVTNGRYAAEKLEIEMCQADFAPLHAWGPNVFMDEPRLRIVASAQLDAAAGTLTIHDATLTGADLAGRLQNAAFALGDRGGLKRLDHGEMQGNLATVSRWLQDPRVPATWQITGLAAGTLQADLNDRAPMLDLSLTVEDLAAVGHGAQQPVAQSPVRVTANASYDEGRMSCNWPAAPLNPRPFSSPPPAGSSNGARTGNCRLAARPITTWTRFLSFWPMSPAERFAPPAASSRTFALTGPLSTALADAGPAARDQAIQQLAGKLDFGWQSASLFGFDVGPGNLQASLERGVLQLVPVRFNVSGGAVTLAPSLSLAPAPPELRVPPGLLVDRVARQSRNVQPMDDVRSPRHGRRDQSRRQFLDAIGRLPRPAGQCGCRGSCGPDDRSFAPGRARASGAGAGRSAGSHLRGEPGAAVEDRL